MPSGAIRRRALAGMWLLAAACRPGPATENPYAELPPPGAEPEPTVDDRLEALQERAEAAGERADAIADEAERQSELPSCGCAGAQACRVRCEPPSEPRCACEVPRCECVDADPASRG